MFYYYFLFISPNLMYVDNPSFIFLNFYFKIYYCENEVFLVFW